HIQMRKLSPAHLAAFARYVAESRHVNTECDLVHHSVEHGLKSDSQHIGKMMCGVCLDVVLAKERPVERSFGILPNCRHCYCLKCIQSWKRVLYAQKKPLACPECRAVSHYYIKSSDWVVDEAEKQALIQKHKKLMAAIPCRYVSRGRGICNLGPSPVSFNIHTLLRMFLLYVSSMLVSLLTSYLVFIIVLCFAVYLNTDD
uniref:RING-type domain-containing protein n=1 Tax=Sander lucioperca TaxID=283035 RepID=A0A8C9XAS2_SANLU